MTDLTTPLAALTPVVTVGGKVGPIPDTAGADAMGLVTASPAPQSLLGRLKAIQDGQTAIVDAIGDIPGGSGGGGDASAANQATEIARLTSILGAVDGLEALVGAVATEATLAALLAKLPASLGAKAASGSLSIVPSTGADLATNTTVAALLASNAPFGGRVAMTVGTAVAAGRAIEIVASAAGNVSLTFADGSTTVVAVAAGTTILDYAVTTVNTSGTTATATYGKLV